MRTDEEALARDLSSPAFKLGVQRRKWALAGVAFPRALFFIAAGARSKGPKGFLLCSDCAGYSATAPTSQLWYGKTDSPLETAGRPKGCDGVLVSFKDWGPCLYHPIDRLARDHNDWPRDHPEKLWTPDKDITFLLGTVYDLLHGSDYLGADLPDEALTVPSRFVAQDHPRAA